MDKCSPQYDPISGFFACCPCRRKKCALSAASSHWYRFRTTLPQRGAWDTDRETELGSLHIVGGINKGRFCITGAARLPNKYTGKCSTSSTVREMQIKTMFRFHLTPVRKTNNKCWQIPAEEGGLFMLKGVYYWCGVVSQHTGVESPSGPSLHNPWKKLRQQSVEIFVRPCSLLNYSQQLRKEPAQMPNNRGHGKNAAFIHSGALFSCDDEWNNVIFRGKWMELKTIIMLSKISQAWKNRYLSFSHKNHMCSWGGTIEVGAQRNEETSDVLGFLLLPRNAPPRVCGYFDCGEEKNLNIVLISIFLTVKWGTSTQNVTRFVLFVESISIATAMT